ncbi:hypothetical protein DFH06DRAFT_1465660 [Mycena polygramma]|nr:hypothetical protein DFH06DRAFT_1465660 [Mycena polygramma]
MSLNTPPFLPPELECEIFETAAELYPGCIPRLLCVSQRVHEWIEKIKFNTVTGEGVHASCPLWVLYTAIVSKSKPATFFHNSVRHLFLPRLNPLSAVQDIMSACSGLQTLQLVHEPHQSLFPYLAAMRPRRLGIHIVPLIKEPEPCMPMFTFVTHLVIIDAIDRIPAQDIASGIEFLARLPALTHLEGLGGFMLPLSNDILASCPTLHVLVVRHGWWPADNLTGDVRYVCRMNEVKDYDGNWIAGTRGEPDFWTRAEAFVAKKRRGEIEPRSRCWIVDEDGI